MLQLLQKYCKHILVIILLLLAYKAFFAKESYGIIMDEACMSGDCSNEAGRVAAVSSCQEKVRALPGYKYFKSACESSDPEIRNIGCPEPCDINSVAPRILSGKKPECVAGTEKVINDITYCQNEEGAYVLAPQKKEMFMY